MGLRVRCRRGGAGLAAFFEGLSGFFDDIVLGVEPGAAQEGGRRQAAEEESVFHHHRVLIVCLPKYNTFHQKTYLCK